MRPGGPAPPRPSHHRGADKDDLPHAAAPCRVRPGSSQPGRSAQLCSALLQRWSQTPPGHGITCAVMKALSVAVAALVLLALGAPSLASSFEDDDLDCKELDYEYALTECDSQRGRWRVQVPRSGRCADNNPRPARRVDKC
ncbi:hypothetical protein FOCC_FOCC005574, partial [Frankliniella occidentalis]